MVEAKNYLRGKERKPGGCSPKREDFRRRLQPKPDIRGYEGEGE